MMKKILKCCSLSVTLFFSTLFSIAQTTLILQPGATAGKDAMVYNYPSTVNTNYGTSGDLPVSAWTAGGTPTTARSFIQFNLSSVPANSSVISASLFLYAVDTGVGSGQHSALSGPNNGWLQRVIAPWDESTITWNNQPASTIVNRVSLPASDSASQDYVSDVTVLMQDILSSASGNFGLMLILDNEQYYRRLNFNSSDYSIASKRPKLVITYCAPPVASISFSGPAQVCAGDSVILTANSGAGYTYQWKLNGVSIPGAISISFAAKTSGFYSVNVINTSGCTGYSSGVTITVGNQFTIVLQPDGTTGKDALIDSYSSSVNTNFGSNESLEVAAWTGGGIAYLVRSFLEFNLAGVPQNSTILSASLSLYGTGQHSTLSGPNNGWIQRVTAAWDESLITWNNQPGTTLQNRVSLPASLTSSQDYTNIDITALIQDMFSIPGNNFGMMIKLDNENYYRELSFYSSDYTDSIKRPHSDLPMKHLTQPSLSLSDQLHSALAAV